ncbi:MAG TPA: hypothetical protein VK988_07960 [Acidimicrobiales bacterium]|nr:hypothetical protein [Acidimicrobiales bacterium]
MPQRKHYEGMSLAQAVRSLAERHHEQATRHISGDEHALLLRAAEVLEREHSSLGAFA